MNFGNTAKARKNFDDPQEGRVYHPKGVAPTIRSGWRRKDTELADERKHRHNGNQIKR